MQEPERDKSRNTLGLPGWTEQRGWTRRLTGQVQYRRFTAVHPDGTLRTCFQFKLLPGQTQLDPAVYAVMKHHQTHEDGEHPTGLTSKKGGTFWYLPAHDHGLAVADRIDMVLQEVANKLDREAGTGR